MKNIKYSLAPFTKAWGMLLDLELPNSVKSSDGNVEEEVMLLNFPAVGAVIGVALYALAWLLNIVPGRPMGPFLAAILITLVLELIVNGRYLSSVLSFIENRVAGYSTPECLAAINDEFNVPRSSTSMLLLISAFLIRILAFGFILDQGLCFWLIIALTVNYGAQGYLAASADMRSGQPFFEVSDNYDRNIWLVVGGVTLVAGLAYFAAVIVCLAIVIFTVYKFRLYCDDILGGMTAKMIGLGGYIAEFIALLVALTILV